MVNCLVKKGCILLLLFLVDCIPVGPSNMPFGKSMEAFTINDSCPHICWLGINPGVTSSKEASTLLRASDQIDQKTFHVREAYLETNWFFQKTPDEYSHVYIYFGKGRVSSIEMNSLGQTTLKDFIDFLGEPDEIIIRLFDTVHCEGDIAYSIYYSLRKTKLSVAFGDWKGPSPNDRIDQVVFNVDFDKLMNAQPLDRQPWLGYGHLQDYLPGQQLPTGPCQP